MTGRLFPQRVCSDVVLLVLLAVFPGAIMTGVLVLRATAGAAAERPGNGSPFCAPTRAVLLLRLMLLLHQTTSHGMVHMRTSNAK